MTPPGPVADVVVINHRTGKASSILSGKLDCAADMTIIPMRVVRLLGLMSIGEGGLRGYDQQRTELPLYYMDFLIEGFTVKAVRCFAMDRPNVLVGRNVLNHFVLTLNGKKQSFTLEA